MACLPWPSLSSVRPRSLVLPISAEIPLLEFGQLIHYDAPALGEAWFDPLGSQSVSTSEPDCACARL